MDHSSCKACLEISAFRAHLYEETALNHVGMSDFVGDGMGTTHAMMRHRLIWVVTRMHIQVDRYPVWGDVVEIDSWVCGSGKNGMRRDFLVRDYATGEILSCATSTWAMMNKDTRKLSKMPDDVKAEISPFFYDKFVMKHEPSQKIKKLDDSALYIRANLVPKLQDMDMNQHVNNVKYIGWVLESIPQSLLVAHELVNMTLEYRQECCPSDVVTSMTDPSSPVAIALSVEDTEGKQKLIKQAVDTACCPSSFELQPPDTATPTMTATGDLKYTHLLRMQADGSEILRGSTTWRLKQRFLNSKNQTQH
ncbi:hypothetical protein O6H91_05G077300 [Diphasiastrum complanatum]|uniref:Uncharacterized protein n=1 Tax=Diphasiastrum complanatum TaxID=34168 RepID=A0ACC2DPU4_DIPCM|nr:hypothetical protein O6H91_05G077300 [Diphasiastrum complanatum]